MKEGKGPSLILGRVSWVRRVAASWQLSLPANISDVPFVWSALGYGSHGGVRNAVRRVDASDRLQQTVKRLAKKLS